MLAIAGFSRSKQTCKNKFLIADYAEEEKTFDRTSIVKLWSSEVTDIAKMHRQWSCTLYTHNCILTSFFLGTSFFTTGMETEWFRTYGWE